MIILGSFIFVSLLIKTKADGHDVASNEVIDYKFQNDSLLTWEAPLELQRDYPYYLSGYDDENCPIWIAEMGKWDVRKIVESGPQREKQYRKYVLQFLKRCQQSVHLRSTPEYPVKEFSIIVDMAGYSARQTATLSALSMSLWMARQFEQAFKDSMKLGYIVNGNYVFTTIWGLMKPILGPNVYKIEIFGSNKGRYIPVLLKTFPKSSLPEWYGGSSNHKPLQIYG